MHAAGAIRSASLNRGESRPKRLYFQHQEVRLSWLHRPLNVTIAAFYRRPGSRPFERA
jgi:hypothetical protein